MICMEFLHSRQAVSQSTHPNQHACVCGLARLERRSHTLKRGVQLRGDREHLTYREVTIGGGTKQ